MNHPQGVEIEVEGTAAGVQAFLTELRGSPPPLARIQEVRTREVPRQKDRTFAIRTSAQDGPRTVLIAPDLATCADCLHELHNPDDRRYRYPFINCTNCGPRYTIIRDLPYDRAKTTMAEFTMCPACRGEYEDPANRRFHAEPTCCPVCGPRVWLSEPSGNPIACDDPVAAAVERLASGEIVAVKGLGGFHLACDASNDEAVGRLRRRKHRDVKPFAVMLRYIEVVEQICHVRHGAEEQPHATQAPAERRSVDLSPLPFLLGPERPIVLIEKRLGHGLAEEVAPRSASFGVMLPYTPLHHLLMEGSFPALVMTSGNISDEPIAHRNDDALRRLHDIGDCYLLHDRGIHIRTDDSVARVIAGGLRFLRRSRGYAPFPVELPLDTTGREILAVGPELNDTICITRGNQAFLSHHIGDLENVPAYEAFLQAIEHLGKVLDVTPGAVACDLHPGYLSTRYARECGLPVTRVQHHHAHIASVVVEARRTDKVIGVAFDGMGWGSDDTLWGGEFLVCDLSGFDRAGFLEPVPQPGGDASAKRPAQMAYAYLRAAFGEEGDALARDLLPTFAADERKVVARQLERNVNCPLTSSMGRLFDAAAALIGICDYNSHHAQAPMELEAEAEKAADEAGRYEVRIEPRGGGALVARGTDIVKGLVADFLAGTGAAVCAARFHNSVAQLSLDVCRQIRENTGLTAVALSGGVFANAFLVERLAPLLEANGFGVLMNAAVPPGDGGVSLGQAAVAAWRVVHTPGRAELPSPHTNRRNPRPIRRR